MTQSSKACARLLPPKERETLINQFFMPVGFIERAGKQGKI